MKYLSLIFVLIFVFCVSFAVPATPQINTPREQIVHELGLDGVPETAKPVQPPLEQIQPKKLKPELAKSNATQTNPKIAAFYLSTDEYLHMRGRDDVPQMVLYYEVDNRSALGKTLGTKKNIKLILGEDFAGIQIDKNLTIYDFKLNRILSVTPKYKIDGKPTDKILLENTSLYAKAYRDIAAVRGATQNGRLKKLNMGKGISLDAFWIESAMSWSAKASDDGLILDETDTSLRVHWGGEIIFSAEFTDEPYALAGIDKNSLFSFAHLEWPLHPSVLRAFYAYDSPPKSFEMLSYGPTAPKGQKQVWTLVKRVDERAAFPLPANAIGVAQMDKVSPLVFLINEAVHNRALGGTKSVERLSKDFKTQLTAEQYWQAWITGQKYIAYSGGCEEPDDTSLCQAIAQIEQDRKGDLPERIQDYMTAVDLAKGSGLNAETVKLIAPYLDKQETPAFIVRTAAMARAKMKHSQARASGLAEMNAETLLLTALAKDPYDPNTYVGLAQILAANGAFEQSWDVYDGLRAGIPTANAVNLKISRLEKNLRKTAPGYFLEK